MNDSDFKKDIDRIEVPEERLDKVIKTAMKGEKPKRSLGKRIIYFTSAAAIFVCLLFGSALVSPAWADTLSKIPILGSVFQLGEPGEDILNKLNEQGYDVKDVSFTYQPEKSVEIRVGGSKDYLAEVKDDVKGIAERILQTKHYDAYNVKIMESWEVDPEEGDKLEPVSKEEKEEQLIVPNKIMEALKKINYKSEFSLIGYYSSKTIEIPIEGSEAYYNKMKDVVKSTVSEVLQESNIEGYTVKVPHRPIKLMKKERWKVDLMPVVNQELMGKKGYHVTKIKSSMEENLMQLNITLSLKRSDSSIKELAEGIKENVTKILESDRFKQITRDFPYEINIYSNDGEKVK
ncbi:DUF4030 domain-containing protein [Virgibacillus ndiopensis]|uniref:DUF4030 domain-containing protein n=1 Tax=Virgibacillus ndiopensis TaxID=2004408 RepID=UPI000C073372|nr:DUF4030 domain-containing protein [Virgibacillus ndiopensis]